MTENPGHRAATRRPRWLLYTAAGLLVAFAIGTAATLIVIRKPGDQVDPAQLAALTDRLQTTDAVTPEVAACVAHRALTTLDGHRLSATDLRQGKVPDELRDAFVSQVIKAFEGCSPAAPASLQP